MTRTGTIGLREIEPSDLEVFFGQQLDRVAKRMAAFGCEDPSDKMAFAAHWGRILASAQITKRTIVADGHVAGHSSCSRHGENLEVTYWLGREFCCGWMQLPRRALMNADETGVARKRGFRAAGAAVMNVRGATVALPRAGGAT